MPRAVVHRERFHLLVLILTAVVRENTTWETAVDRLPPGEGSKRSWRFTGGRELREGPL